MKKKIIIALLMVALAAGGAFAQMQMSVGGGAFFASDLGGGVSKGSYSVTFPYVGGGGYAFFDPVPYAEVNVGFFYGGGKFKVKIAGLNWEEDATYSALDIGVMGKYPIALGDALSLYPALGITYRAFTTAVVGSKTYDASDFSSFWISLGGGVDVTLTDKLFLRANALYGFRLSSQMEDDYKDQIDGDIVLGHGLTVKLAVGYKL
jgi:hypothetical protein